MKHPEFRIFVEGGGDRRELLDKCRNAFGRFFEKAELGERRPKVIACGSRHSAYEDYCSALARGSSEDIYLLLVDSEAQFQWRGMSGEFWGHVLNREGDRWDRPEKATEDQLHFMVETMENWFYADQDLLLHYFGEGFSINALAKRKEIEEIPKSDVNTQLANATRVSKKGEYRKASHSFAILEKLSPQKVAALAPVACRLLYYVRKYSGVERPEDILNNNQNPLCKQLI